MFLLHHPDTTFKPTTSDSYDSIASLQADQGTNGRRFLYGCGGHYGFGSELNTLLAAFTYSFATRRQFILACEKWNYGKFDDFFTFPKNSNRSLPYRFLVGNNTINERFKFLKTNFFAQQMNASRQATRKWQTIERKRSVAQYFWRQMTRETSQFVEQCRIRNLSNYIGLHVRRGDKLLGEARKVPLEKYIQKIEKELPNQKHRSVFATSDDGSVLEELRRLRANWTFLSVNRMKTYTRSTSGHYQSRFNQLSLEEKRYETRLLICQLQMLVDADYVFCTITSNICRLVQILRLQDPSTTISLDRKRRAA